MRLAPWLVLPVSIALVPACGGESLPRTVDAHWVERCQGGMTNLYGLTREKACISAALGFERAGDAERATGFYRRACEIGAGSACLDWARHLRARGNIAGERFVLGSMAPCETPRYRATCGMQLVTSYETEEPTMPEEVKPMLRRLCKRHVSTACARLEEMHEPIPDAAAAAEPSDDKPPPVKRAAAASKPPSASSAVAAAPPAPPPGTCHMLSKCVTLDVHHDVGPCEGALHISATNHCGTRVHCQWCQARGADVLDRSTCGSQDFEDDKTYQGVASFCGRATKGENVVYSCSVADDPPSCTSP